MNVCNNYVLRGIIKYKECLLLNNNIHLKKKHFTQQYIHLNYTDLNLK